MLFPTIDFAIFFCIVFLGHWLLNAFRRPWKLFMIAASYVFYAWWDPRLVWLLALVSLLAQLGALAVARARGRGERARRVTMVVAVVATLLPLVWFKYYGFFSLNFANWLHLVGAASPLPLLQITLPVGISFYSFMAVSYVVDVFRGVQEPAAWIDAFLYLSFFPHLVAGPIVRAGKLIPQIEQPRNPRRVDASRAAYLVLGGLFKKVVLSSFLSTAIVDPVFANPAGHSALEVLFAVYGYAIVIYADFSGYTDIAIGIALALGFEFPQNFDRPYAARSLQDFWQRWHITLSQWLRDYLYVPLGGNRRGESRSYVNIFLTMAIGGLWHGAAWTFVIWGMLHGVGQVVGHRRRTVRAARGLAPMDEGRWPRARQRFWTFQFVCLGWLFFRADSMANVGAMLGRLVTGWTMPSPLLTPLVLLAIAFGLAMQFAPHRPAEVLQAAFSRIAPATQGALVGLSLFAITTLGPQGVAPFIYFRF